MSKWQNRLRMSALPQEESMSKKDIIEAKTEEFILPILEEKGFYLYDVEYVKEGQDYYLRVYIDKEGGITVDDCEVVSREMNVILDSEDYVQDQYIFEVSSPGLGRRLTKDRHYDKSIGDEVELKTFKPLFENDKNKQFTGVLKGYDDNTVSLEIDGKNTAVEKSNIADLRLTIDF